MRTTLFLTLGLFASACQTPQDATATGISTAGASFGARTRAPSDAEAKAMGLPFDVRMQGQAIDSIVPGGPASRAGLHTGDVVLRLDDNVLYSRDDVHDFLRAADAGTSVDIHLRRSGTAVDMVLPIVLGSPTGELAGSGIEWEYASLAQLPSAMDRAHAEQRRLLVGLSGAET